MPYCVTFGAIGFKVATAIYFPSFDEPDHLVQQHALAVQGSRYESDRNDVFCLRFPCPTALKLQHVSESYAACCSGKAHRRCKTWQFPQGFSRFLWTIRPI